MADKPEPSQPKVVYTAREMWANPKVIRPKVRPRSGHHNHGVRGIVLLLYLAAVMFLLMTVFGVIHHAATPPIGLIRP